MKKTLILLSAALMLLSMPMQAQDLARLAKNVEKAIANTENPKKASNPDTWVKLGKEYIKAFEATLGNGLLNTPKDQIVLLMGDAKPISSQMVTLDGKTYLKESYACFDYYYNNNVLVMMVPTKSAVEDPLGKAYDAFVKAKELDEKGKKTKEIAAAVKQIVEYQSQQAFYQYNLGNKAEAAALFEKAGLASLFGDPVVFEGGNLSNAGMVYAQVQNFDKAEACYKMCLDHEFYDDDGNVFAQAARVAAAKKDTTARIAYLKQGIEKFPSSKIITIDLILAYQDSGQDLKEVFELVDKAIALDPTNASLYYTKGNLYKEVKNYEAAIECYRKTCEVDPKFPYGYIGEGLVYIDQAKEYSQKAAELPVNAYKEYDAMMKQSDDTLVKCIAPFEKAFELADSNPELKTSLADYLKRIYYQLASKDETYMAGYKKYNDFLKAQ